MTPGDMLDVIDAALATPQPFTWWWRPSPVILRLTAARVLGEVGRLMDDGSYGYTREQVLTIRQEILAAVIADDRAMSEIEAEAREYEDGLLAEIEKLDDGTDDDR